MTDLTTISSPPAVIETQENDSVDLETGSDVSEEGKPEETKAAPRASDASDAEGGKPEETTAPLDDMAMAMPDVETRSDDAPAINEEAEDIVSLEDIPLTSSAAASDSTLLTDNRPTFRRGPSLMRGLHRDESSRWGLSEPHLLRRSSAIDLSTGNMGAKETVVEEVTSHREAMNNAERMYNQLFGIGTDEDQEAMEMGTPLPKQYRLTARPSSQQKRTWLQLVARAVTCTRDEGNDYDVTVGSKAEYLTLFLRWTFRTSFVMLLSFSCACFMMLACAFAIAIHIVGIYQPMCISVSGLDYNTAGRYFIDAFALSWTTLSTVGYGHIYPSLAIQGNPRCLAVNFFCTFESFVGVLFASFMGAILMGKIARVQSFAPTTFSDPIVVRYGSGLLPSPTDDHTESSSVKSTDSNKQIPCPIMEFRIVNRMWSAGGGEIMNCKLNVVASILESDASEEVKNMVLHKSHQKKKPLMLDKAGRIVTGSVRQAGSVASGTAKQVGKVAGSTAKQVGRATGASKIVSGTAKQVGNVAGSLTSSVSNVAGSVAAGVSTQAGRMSNMLRASLVGIDEGKAYDPDVSFARRSETSPAQSGHAPPTARQSSRAAALVDEGSTLAPRRIFTNLDIETPAHPFFKRVWNVRHVLDQNSPILTATAKQMIIDNNGFWPEELNNYKAIRDNLCFHEIIVNLSGTANATGNVVYCQKVYSFVDGTFVECLKY